ncbi:MAG TPA: permease prefix domain 1-containing protein, partial [Gemmatimonadaceae bacterium]
MPTIRVWVKRLLKPLRARRVEREMEDEMLAHIEMEVDALTQSGVAYDEARRQALATFGGVARFRDDARDAWPM